MVGAAVTRESGVVHFASLHAPYGAGVLATVCPSRDWNAVCDFWNPEMVDPGSRLLSLPLAGTTPWLSACSVACRRLIRANRQTRQAKAERKERLGVPTAELRDFRPAFPAITQLKPRSSPIFPLGNDPGLGSWSRGCLAGARPDGPLLVTRWSPSLQRRSKPAFQQGHPIARPATVSFPDTNTMPENVSLVNVRRLWKLLTSLLIICSDMGHDTHA